MGYQHVLIGCLILMVTKLSIIYYYLDFQINVFKDELSLFTFGIDAVAQHTLSGRGYVFVIHFKVEI